MKSTTSKKIYEAGLELIESDFPIVACVGKVPTWDGRTPATGWQNKPYSEEDLKAALRTNADPAIGLKLGPMGGYIDIETDSPEEELAFSELFDGCEIPPMPTYESPRGKHRLFKWDPRLEATDKAVFSFQGSKSKLGCRLGAGGKGAQSVLPPSPGRKWLVSFDQCEAPALPEKVIERITNAGKAPRTSTASLFAELPNGQRNNTLFSLASSMRRQGQDQASITAAIKSHNTARCNPPLARAEVEGIAASVMRYPAGSDTEQAIREICKIEQYTLAELQEKHPVLKPVLVEGLVRQEETINIIAPSKFGKSWGMYGLALSIITHTPWLGRFTTGWGRVLLIDNELHKSTLAHRIPQVGDAMLLKRDDYVHDLHIWPLRGNLRSWQELAADLEKIDRGYYKLIILDAKYRFASPGMSENDNSTDTLVYNLLDQLAESTGAAIALVHHSSKGSQSEKRVTDVGSGAGAQSRAADCHIILREHAEEGVAVLEAAVRSFPPVEPVALRFQFPLWLPDLSVDTRNLRGNLTKADHRQDERDKQASDKIIKALLKKGSSTATQMRDRTGLSRDRAVRVLNLLEDDGQIESREIVHRGNECLEYRLLETDK